MVKANLKSNKGFYVGDICYVLDDEIYDKIWGAAGYRDGEYETEFGKFAVASTAYGDGEYDDQFGHSYGVDAGVIGIVPWEILDKQKKWREQYGSHGGDMETLNYLGHFFEATEADFYGSGRNDIGEDGLFEINFDTEEQTVTIHTTWEEEDWDDYEEEFEEYPEDDEDTYPMLGDDE